jgi:hypothetical protein
MKNRQNEIQQRTRNAQSLSTLIEPTAIAILNDRNKYRKQQKPQYARFKASLKYFDKEYPCPMYSYDWNKDYSTGIAVSKDNERIGLEKLKLWALKQIKNENLERVRIFITLRKDKRTDIKDYDLCILDFNHNMSLDLFRVDMRLKFDVNDRVILHLLEGRTNE